MQVVINISKEDFTLIRSVNNPNLLLLTESTAMLAVKNGKPLDSVLDEIKAKIEQMDFDFGDFYDHTSTIREMVLEVIDKYKAESEDKE